MNQDTGFAKVGIAAALASYALVFLQFQVAGLILGLVAIAFGAAGYTIAASLRLRDRNMSGATVVLGFFATVLAVIVLVF